MEQVTFNITSKIKKILERGTRKLKKLDPKASKSKTIRMAIEEFFLRRK